MTLNLKKAKKSRKLQLMYIKIRTKLGKVILKWKLVVKRIQYLSVYSFEQYSEISFISLYLKAFYYFSEFKLICLNIYSIF